MIGMASIIWWSQSFVGPDKHSTGYGGQENGEKVSQDILTTPHTKHLIFCDVGGRAKLLNRVNFIRQRRGKHNTILQ